MLTLAQLAFFYYLSFFIENSSSISQVLETHLHMSYWSNKLHSSFLHFNSYVLLAFYKGVFSSLSEQNITSFTNIKINNKIWHLIDL